MKTEIINVRIPEEYKNLLKEESLNNGVSISDTIRSIIDFYYYEIPNEEFEPELYNSNQFLYLIAWMFNKKGCPQDYSTKQELIDLKNIVLKVIKDNQLTDSLIEEFENVLGDLQRFIYEYSSENNQFRFCKMYQRETFDYDGLLQHTAIRAFENRIQL